jgi:uncharacterized membrane-anchored protein
MIMEAPLPVAGRFRALDTRPVFWMAMFMASAFGANLGDYLADLNSRTVSGAVMAVVCLVALWGDRREGLRTEAWYWVAVIALRAAATNAADVITDELHLSYPAAALALGILTLLAGLLTRGPAASAGSPLIEGRYWLAMALAGLGGTVAGDLMSHTVGLFGSAAVLTAFLVLVLVVRAWQFPLSLLAYWVAVLAERSAATPVADVLHGRHGLHLPLSVALAITLLAFLLALVLRRRLRARSVQARMAA